MKHASALVTNFAPAPIFEVAADDFALCLRARMHLPSRIAPFFNMPAHLLMFQRGIATQVHDHIRDSITETAILADHMAKVEPQGIYGETHNGGVDGIMDIMQHGPVEPSASAVATSAVRGRIAFDIFTCADPKTVAGYTTRKKQRYEDSVKAAGDSFVAAPFTPSGCPYPSALSFLRDLAHTGDSVPLSAGRDIHKFDSEAATWATPTHVTFMVHAAAAAAARGLAGAIKDYCIRRLADRYVVRAVETAPPLVPRPDS